MVLIARMAGVSLFMCLLVGQVGTTGGETRKEGVQPGPFLTITKVKYSGPDDAIEIYNTTSETIDFAGWYLGTHDGTELLGIPGNIWSVLSPQAKRILRRGEIGSFTTDLDYQTVLYLFTPEFVNVEQLGWSRPDNFQSTSCVTRFPDTAGFHDGFDWYSSGGGDNPFAGQLQYSPCPDGMLGPQVGVEYPDNGGKPDLGVYPNPAPRTGSVQLAIGAARAGNNGSTTVTVTVHDIRGRELYRSLREQQQGAPLLFALRGTDLLSAGTASGLVFVTASTSTWTCSKPLILLD